MIAEEVGGLFATSDEDDIANVHLYSQITVAWFGCSLRFAALCRRLCSTHTLWRDTCFAIMEF